MSRTATLREVYEVVSPSVPGLTLDAQILAGCNDWVAIDTADREHFGRTKADALRSLTEYNFKAAK